MYAVIYTKRADKDKLKLKSAKLDEKAKRLIDLVHIDPFQNPPPFEKLLGDLDGAYSRRINIQHRFIYEVLPNIEEFRDENEELYEGIVKVISLWTHYE